MWKDRIKQEWDENPIAVIAIGGMVLTALAKIIDSWSSAQSRRAYARQVDQRNRRYDYDPFRRGRR